RIARRTEVHPGVQFTENLIQEDGPEENQGKGRQMLAAAATKIARQLKVPGMLVITRKGRGATKMANLRVRGIPIFAFTESEKTISTLMLLRGVYPYLLKFDEDPELTIQNALRLLKKKQDMPSGISIVVVADIMTGEGYVNCLQVRTLPED
ncbi:MAG: pyruvate kinase alpha/beta domain-containing protein, partial [SAR324 cluster bacterium]|nr:pyruvate kinase alpha/beta domain-containing protein [SAR324 cluster bacterium]